MMPLGVSGHFITNGNCGFGILFSIGTLLVKITDEMLKKHKYKKALNIGNWVLD
jgi:hypothetical protein